MCLVCVAGDLEAGFEVQLTKILAMLAEQGEMEEHPFSVTDSLLLLSPADKKRHKNFTFFSNGSSLPASSSTLDDASSIRSALSDTQSSVHSNSPSKQQKIVGLFRMASQTGIGYAYILVVVIIWVCSSFVIQFVEGNHISSFILTYVSTSLFLLLLPFAFISRSCSTSALHQTLRDCFGCNEDLEKRFRRDDIAGREKDHRGAAKGRVCRWKTTTTEQLKNTKVALGLLPLWFGANYFYNVSLCHTSVGASTILSGVSSIFTLLLSGCFGAEAVTKGKVIGVIFCFSGVIFVGLDALRKKDFVMQETSVMQLESEQSCVKVNSVKGDLIALVSSMFYACYSVYLKTHLSQSSEMPKPVAQSSPQRTFSKAKTSNLEDPANAAGEGGISFQNHSDAPVTISTDLVFGYLGLASLVLLFPLVWMTSSTELWNLLSIPSQRQFLRYILVNGFFNNVISDYLWARAVVFTSPTTVTVGVSLTIPASAILDWLLNGIPLTADIVLGGVLIIVGFICVVKAGI